MGLRNGEGSNGGPVGSREIKVPLSEIVHTTSMSTDGRNRMRAEVEMSNGMKFTVAAREAIALAEAAREFTPYRVTIVLTPVGASKGGG